MNNLLKEQINKLWQEHTLLIVCAGISLFLFFIFSIFQLTNSEIMKLSTQWLFVAGVPLLLAPTATANLLGFEITETLPLRLVGAALIGIGGTSIIKKEANIDSYRSLLTLKIIWSFSAIVGILLSIPESTSTILWGILAIFVTFNIVWVYYYLILVKSTD